MGSKLKKPKKVVLKAPMKRTNKCLKTKKLVCSNEVGPGWKDKNRFKIK